MNASDVDFYTVTVTVTNLSNGNTHDERINFKSLWSARYMAKEYYKCADVQGVVVLNANTGEIMYEKTPTSEWDAEG